MPRRPTRARSYFTGYPPSSPQIGLLKDGQLVFMLERWQIEGRPADEIAHDLVNAFNRYCAEREPLGRGRRKRQMRLVGLLLCLFVAQRVDVRRDGFDLVVGEQRRAGSAARRHGDTGATGP